MIEDGYDYFVINCQQDVAVMGPLDHVAALSAVETLNAREGSVHGPRFTIERYRPPPGQPRIPRHDKMRSL